MTYWKRLLAALFALISVFVFTLNTTALAATATTTTSPTIPPEELLKIKNQILDLQDRLDSFDDLFDDGSSADVEKQFPSFVKDVRSSFDDLKAKVITPTNQAKYDTLSEKFTGYFTKLDDATTAYKTAKDDYETATKTYQDTVKSTYDKVVASLDSIVKLLPKAE